ncbi:MAG TPA: XTP/dITP diphosphatase [Deltaproteobacteria bacterium]|jgi:XTP/dITP diphosphohydrolase|nr:XTP/dITP diphosphatase [Deltaproteobacteria bacterium]
MSIPGADPIVVIATKNSGKSAEIKGVLKDFPVLLKDLNDFGPLAEPVEDGTTFEENAYKKASFTARVLGLPALADDSGLKVQELAGAPGIHSARYAGLGATDSANNAKLLKALSGKANRKARFCCVLSLAVPSGAALTYEAFCEGLILDSARGDNGFGYDPLFLYPPMGKTFAEMSTGQKLSVSHRGLALRELKNEFEKVLRWLQHRQAEEEMRRGANGMCCDK